MAEENQEQRHPTPVELAELPAGIGLIVGGLSLAELVETPAAKLIGTGIMAVGGFLVYLSGREG